MSAAKGVPAKLPGSASLPVVVAQGAGEVAVVAGAVRVARHVSIEAALDELLGGALLAPEAAAGDEVRRGLQLAAQVHQALGQAEVLLDGAVALRVGDDHAVAETLELVDGALVVAEGVRRAAGVELEEELVGVREGQARRPLAHAELLELLVRDLEAHGERHVRVAAEQLEGGPHGVVVEVGVARVGGAHDARDACLAGGVDHLQAHGEV